MKGRKPSSRNLSILKGTQKDGPVKISKPQPARERWNCPKWVGSEGRKFHKDYFPIAKRIGALTEFDRDSWFLLCQTYFRIRQCHSELDRDGLTVTDSRQGIKKHPATAVLNQLMAHFRALSDQFGLNPQSRERLGLSVPKVKSRMAQMIDGADDDDLLSS